MDAPRFDAFVRAISSAHSRRDLIKSMSVFAAGLIALRPLVLRADTDTGDSQTVTIPIAPTPTPTAVGGSQTTTITSDPTPAATVDAAGGTDEPGGTTDTAVGSAVCLPIARTGPEDEFLPPFFAEIIAGSCDTASGESVFELLDVDADDGVTAVPPAAFMSRSVTTVQAELDDLIADRHSIVVRVSLDDPAILACGEIGGILQGDELAAGIKERNNSGYSGVSLLRGANGSTLVYIFLGQGLSTLSTSPAAVGTVVVTTADVNVRIQPAVDSEIITVVPTGAELSVTGPSVGEWVPVEVPGTGETGYVSAQFVEVLT